jgi:hypothetical protein
MTPDVSGIIGTLPHEFIKLDQSLHRKKLAPDAS